MESIVAAADRELMKACEEFAVLAIAQEIEKARKNGEEISIEEADRRVMAWMKEIDSENSKE